MKTIDDKQNKKNDKKGFLSHLRRWIDSMKKVDDDDYENLDFLPNPKYKEYADENGEIPIFVMEKKHLITDWANKIGFSFFGWLLIVAIVSDNDNPKISVILSFIVAICVLYCIIWSFLHDVFVRKLIFYSKYFKVINYFACYKIQYYQVPYFQWCSKGLSFENALRVCVCEKPISVFFKKLSQTHFGKKDINHLAKLLKHKGIKNGEWSFNESSNKIKGENYV